MNDVKPCPWCGSEGVIISGPFKSQIAGSINSADDIATIYYVQCSNDDCKAMAPNGIILADKYFLASKAINQAVEVWNTRKG